MEQLRAYFESHKCLNLSAVEKAAGLPAKTVAHFVKGRRSLNDDHAAKLIAIVSNYGYVPNLVQDQEVVPKTVQPCTKNRTTETHVPKMVQPRTKNGTDSARVPNLVQVCTKNGTKEKNEKASFAFNLCNAAWFKWFEHHKSMKPAFDGAEGKALKMIIKKLVEKARQKEADESPSSIQGAFKWLLSRVEQSKWIFERADLKLINSKFNELIAKNGNTTPKKPSASDLIAEAKRRAASNKQS